MDAVIGYLHRCHEKLAETLTYTQYPSIASKTDYVAAMTSELAYVRAAEIVAKFEVPKRAQYLRVLVAELQRIASHCLWLGTWCLDMGGALGGGATIFLYCIRERESGARPLRGARGRPAPLRLPPGRRHALRLARGLGRDVPEDGGRHRQAHRRVRGDAGGQRVLPRAHARAWA